MIRSPFQKHLKRSTIQRKPPSQKEILDSIVSRVIRLGSADDNGMVLCVTCGKKFHWSVIQCGHFQKRGNMSTRYDMKNLAPQCEECNCFNDGENDKFADFIDSFYGIGTADSLREQAHVTTHDFPYQQEIMKWSAVLQTLVDLKSNQIEY